MQVYLDNAASAPILPEVLAAMTPYMAAAGNPSAIHYHGRWLRVGIERARKEIAAVLDVAPAEIFFTSGGTEANNWALKGAVAGLGVQEVLSSALEHASVRVVLNELVGKQQVRYQSIPHDTTGQLDMPALQAMLTKSRRPTLVSLVHANNEIGNVLDLEEVADMLGEGVFLHSDMVQSIGHLPISLRHLPVHTAAASAHKFHGPRGIGLLYIKQAYGLPPLLQGGGQERSMRAGSENAAAIVGMAKALSMASTHMQTARTYVQKLKNQLIAGLRQEIVDVSFYGRSANKESLPTILSISLPPVISQEDLLMRLDVAGISASVGSACMSGSVAPSPVLQALDRHSSRVGVRISFSHLNSSEEVKYCIKILSAAIKKTVK